MARSAPEKVTRASARLYDFLENDEPLRDGTAARSEGDARAPRGRSALLCLQVRHAKRDWRAACLDGEHPRKNPGVTGE